MDSVQATNAKTDSALGEFGIKSAGNIAEKFLELAMKTIQTLLIDYKSNS